MWRGGEEGVDVEGVDGEEGVDVEGWEREGVDCTNSISPSPHLPSPHPSHTTPLPPHNLLPTPSQTTPSLPHLSPHYTLPTPPSLLTHGCPPPSLHPPSHSTPLPNHTLPNHILPLYHRDLLEKIVRFEERVFEKEANPMQLPKPLQLLVPLNTGGGDKLLQLVCSW